MTVVQTADRISPRRRGALIVTTIVITVSLAACGGGGSKKARFAANLRQLGLTSDEASCVTDQLYRALTSDEIDEFYTAAQQGSGNQAAIPVPLRQKLYAAVAPCAATSGPASG